jgi:hypothetical protein
MKLEGGFTLIGLMDGTTVNGFLRVEGTPLVQRYNKGTSQFTPDFETLADNKKPTLVVILRDVSTGEIMTPQTITYKYNGVTLTFGSDGLSTNSGMTGYFKKLDSYSATIGSQSYQLPALRVMKNLVPISGYDNDRISVSGTIEIGGQSIAFNELSKDVVIQESTGNAYDVIISDDKGGALTEAGESLTCTASLYKDGIEVTDYSGFTFQWVKLLGTGDTNWGTARTQKVTTGDIDNILKLRCDIKSGGSVVASGFTQITDYSDPYYVDFNITGITGNAIRSGETAVIKPVARKRSDGTDGGVSNWSWNIKDNAGNAFTLTGKSGATFTAASASVTYEDIKRADMGLSGSVSATA